MAMAIFDTTVAELRARIAQLEKEVDHRLKYAEQCERELQSLTAENQRLKSPLAEGYAARITQLEAELAHWQACHGVAADLIVELQFEKQRPRADGERVLCALESLYALVKVECPALLEEDNHYEMVSSAIDAARGGK